MGFVTTGGRGSFPFHACIHLQGGNFPLFDPFMESPELFTDLLFLRGSGLSLNHLILQFEVSVPQEILMVQVEAYVCEDVVLD